MALNLVMALPEQPSPDGLAQAFIVGPISSEDGRVALILGDNILPWTWFK